MPEARLEQTEYGLAPADEGWFVVSVRDGAWMHNEPTGSRGHPKTSTDCRSAEQGPAAAAPGLPGAATADDPQP